MRTLRQLQEIPVYVATAWWRESEPFLTIVGGSEKAVETAIQFEMLRVAAEAYDQQSTKERARDDFLIDMSRSFAKRDTLGNVLPAHVLDNYCSEKMLPHRSFDSDNFQSLVNGDPNAVVTF